MPVSLAITPGEPAGVGPELLIRLAESPRTRPWVAVADADLLAARARALGAQIRLDDDCQRPASQAGRLTVRHVPLEAESVPGRLDPRNAAYVLETLKLATDGCLSGEFAGLLTGPVQKSVMNDAGIPFTGHTEFLCERAGVADVLMLLVADTLRVGLATTHLPLRAVPDALTRALLDRRLGLLLDGLREDFGITRPRVLVSTW